MLISNAEIEDVTGLDLRIQNGHIQEIGSGIKRQPGEQAWDADGGSVIPGLHDHHIHLYALAAAAASTACGPPDVRTASDLAQALARACRRTRPDGWVRGIGYHESVAGDLDRHKLDRWTGTTPVRIQHRSGALWVLNSEAMKQLPLTGDIEKPGIERDAQGLATGRLFRLDDWLRDHLGPPSPPELKSVGDLLARRGVTGVTDATPSNDASTLAAFTDAIAKRQLRQRLWIMGRPELPSSNAPGIERSAVKIMLDDARLPDFDGLRERIEQAHAARRSVAIHCVTRAELVFATEALAAAGVRDGDRIEHAAVTPPELMQRLSDLSLQVVTQHGFLYPRGDAYARDVEPQDRPWLYRGRGFLDAGVPLGGGTDAPFGPADPWRCIRDAVARRTENGQVLEAPEALSPENALALFTTAAEAPGSHPRRVAVGCPADLCVLDRPWSRARSVLSSDLVAGTICRGEILWRRV